MSQTFNGFPVERIWLATAMSVLAGACTVIGALAVYADKFLEGRSAKSSPRASASPEV